MKPITPSLTPSGIRILCASLLGMMIAEGPIVQKTFGLFMLPMADELLWSRGQLSMLAALAAWASVPLMPLAGAAIDRFGARRVLLPGLVLFATLNAGLGLAGSSALQQFTMFLATGASGAAVGVLTYATVISKNFASNKGLALGIALGAGSALGAAVIPQIAQVFIESLGWRGARGALSGVVIVGGLLVLTLLPKDQASLIATPKTQSVSDGISKAVWREPTMWIIVIAGSLTNLVFAAVSVHLVPLLTDRGISLGAAAFALSVFGISHLAGQIMAGFMLDRISRPQIAVPFFITALVGIVLIHSSLSIPLLLMGAFLMGWGHGAELGAGAYFFARYFGVSSFGSKYGVMVLFGSIAAGLGPLLMGISFDTLNSYAWALSIFEVVQVLSILLIAALPQYPVEPNY